MKGLYRFIHIRYKFLGFTDTIGEINLTKPKMLDRLFLGWLKVF